MDGPWYFDRNDPYLDWFEEDLLRISDSMAVMEVAFQELEALQQRHVMTGFACMIDDDVVYIVKTGYHPPPLEVPPLAIALIVETTERVLRPFLACKADEVSLENAGGPPPDPDAPPREPIENRIRRRLSQRRRSRRN